MVADGDSNITISNSTVHRNNATYGGGIRVENSCSLTVLSSSLDNNTATAHGGGLNIANNVSVSTSKHCTLPSGLQLSDLRV